MKKLSFISVLSLLFSIAFIPGLMKQSVVSAATLNLKDTDIATVVNENTEISSKYTFYPEFTSDTTVETFGSGWSKKFTTETSNESAAYWSFVPTSDNQKGKQGVIYKNVGLYEGKVIDLKITVMDWDSLKTEKGNIGYRMHNIGHIMQGYNSVTQKWEFIDHESGKSVKINGYLTINDIDSIQGVAFTDAQVNNFDHLYVTNDDWLKYEHTNSKHLIFDSGNASAEESDKFASFTATFSDQSSVTFDWVKMYRYASTKPTPAYDTALISPGQYFSITGTKLARTEAIAPEKYINTSSSSEMKLEKENVLTSYKQNFTYEIINQVHDEYTEFYYSNYQMKDVVPKGLKIESIKVYDKDQKDVSGLFDDKSNGNSVLLEAKSSSLEKGSFYGNTYRVEIKVVPASLDDLKPLVENNVIEWKNTATNTINGVTKSSNTAITKLYQRNVTENHIDKTEGKTIITNSVKKFDGEFYSYGPKTNLTYKYNNISYPYMPESTEKQEGTVNGKDVTVDFYYTHPIVELGTKKIQIFTDKYDKGLPVKLQYNVGLLGSSTGWDTEKVDILITNKDTDKQVLKKTLTVKELKETVELKIPKDALKVDYNANYEALIVPNDKKKVFIQDEKEKIDTDGYTSSEEQLNLKADDVETTIYKGVVMTEREIGKEMKKFHETLTLPTLKQNPIKSGYGVDMTKQITYKNDLKSLTSIKAQYLVDNRLIDSYVEYPQKESKAIINAVTTSSETSNNDTLQQTVTLPKVYIEEKTGAVFSEEQKQSGDDRIHNELKDGGNKLYIPIWLDELGSYDVQFKSIDPVGANQVSFNIQDSINVYAYMYGYIGSDTIKKDEILIEPVDPENPFPDGLPEGWTDDDLTWFQE
ncbi:hypothetical protein CEQ21_07360 (plasmid) [Niallia circulans]|uniref:Uncharacterized protein n=1 Tax=Niallia circulans TaxID=1397 RepID=A0A553SQV6_NIACI|nr:hypothetical protein [Niallia circulans]TRZ39371.1 hypothetical protein CEQ21_07360 [Niallia circulans]